MSSVPTPNPIDDNRLFLIHKYRWCNKCQCVFYAGISMGVCAAGGVHDATGSGDIVLIDYNDQP